MSVATVTFAKYEALRNDFVIVGGRASGWRWTADRVAEFCDRRAGVGADGLIALGPVEHGSASFRLYNADGGAAEWSGNGVRCAIAYCQDREKRAEVRFMTLAGNIRAQIEIREGGRRWAWFERPMPVVRPSKKSAPRSIPVLAGPFVVNAGNPHRVYLVRHFDFEWERVGEDCQAAARHTHGTNVEFVRVASPRRIEMRLFERGVGPTPASGSGALAAIAACLQAGQIENHGTALAPGGAQDFQIDKQAESVRLAAPVRRVFDGRWEVS